MKAQRTKAQGARENEAALFAALAEGDLSALGVLYDRYARDVRRFLLRATGRLDVADDVTHEVFIALLSAAKRFDDRFAARSFLLGIAAKLVLRRRRRLATHLRLLAEMARLVPPSDARTPEAVAAADEELERYQRALRHLSDAKRVTLVMADVEGLSGAEIASLLGVPVGTVWTRLHHARAEMIHLLAEDGS